MKNAVEYTGRHPSYAVVSEDTISQAMHICGAEIFLLANLRNASENDNNPPAIGAFNKIMKQMRAAFTLFFSKGCAAKKRYNHCPRHGVNCPRFSPIK